ncbi:MAG: hypothetical protein ACLFWD_07390 [Anaerolineales bacterium]
MSIVDIIPYMFGLTLATALVESVSRYAVESGQAFAVFSPDGVPMLIGFAVLIVAALYFRLIRENMSAAVQFVVGFLVVGVAFAFLSVDRAEPLQLLAHL